VRRRSERVDGVCDVEGGTGRCESGFGNGE
jgi:hypothetical protein